MDKLKAIQLYAYSRKWTKSQEASEINLARIYEDKIGGHFNGHAWMIEAFYEYIITEQLKESKK
jgi:hypothetical protein